MLIGVVEFLSELGGLRIFGDLLGLAVSGGFFVVPLYAIIQNRSEEASRLGVCADASCDGLVLDLSRNRSRRFCSVRCANRNAAAAYRARERAAADG